LVVIIIGDLTSSTSQTIDFAEVSEEIERERAAIYGWSPPKVELRVCTTDLENHYSTSTVLSGGMIFGDVSCLFSFSDFEADATNCNCNCKGGSAGCAARLGSWCWYCGRYTRVVGYFFHPGPSVRIGLKSFHGRSSERESGLLDVPLPCGGYSIRIRTVSS